MKALTMELLIKQRNTLKITNSPALKCKKQQNIWGLFVGFLILLIVIVIIVFCWFFNLIYIYCCCNFS